MESSYYLNYNGPSLINAFLTDPKTNKKEDVLLRFLEIYGDEQNWHQKIYKASSLFLENDIGKVCKLVFERKNTHFSNKEDFVLFTLQSLDMVINPPLVMPLSVNLF